MGRPTVSPVPVERRATRALFALMWSQHGVASRSQARRAGVTRSIEQRLIDLGALVCPLPGVVAAGGVRPTFAAQAMAATLRPGVIAVSHGAAARLHRLAGFEDHGEIDVIGSRGSHIHAQPPIVAHYSRGPIEQHIVRVAAIPVTSIALTLSLVTSEETVAKARAALDDVLGRGVPVATIRGVADEWSGPGRTGPGLLVRLLDRWVGDGRIRSA